MFIRGDVKKIKIALFTVLMLGAIFLFVNNFALAQTNDLTGIQYGAATGLSQEDPRVVVAKVIRIALGFLGILAVGLIIYGGWLYMTSEGNEEQVKKALAVLRNGAIGLLIILSAFGIVSFIISAWLGNSTSGGNNSGGSITTYYTDGLGSIGSCSVESVYPEDHQSEEAPRNTSIIVTFREAVDPNTVCSLGDNDTVCNGQDVLTDNVKIFLKDQESACLAGQDTCELVAATVSSNDNKTFVFTPKNYLGSADASTWYAVYINNNLQLVTTSGQLGGGAFDKCRANYLHWEFKVSNKLDLTSPQVESIFPRPDSQKDTVTTTSEAAQARASIAVNSSSLPHAEIAASATNITPNPNNSEQAISFSANSSYNCTTDGEVIVNVNGDSSTINANGVSGFTGGTISGGSAYIGCGITIESNSGSFISGNEWTFHVISSKVADNILINGVTYTFGQQIAVGATAADAANNIANVLNNNSLISAVANGNTVNLTAKTAGEAGNNISVNTNNTSALVITPMHGGQDRVVQRSTNDAVDQPTNAVIQINFDEAVLPTKVSGSSDQVKDYLRVVNLSSGNQIVPGAFVISNGYKTVEFKPANQCGVNACGEQIFCLPENANLRVELVAANLADCGADNCVSKSPYATCSGDNHCQNTSGVNYPSAQLPASGIVDVASNSLDGNKNGKAEGPISFYNLNSLVATDGDSYAWSFYINDQKDTTSPLITATDPGKEDSAVNLSNELIIDFNKLMMSSSLKTGEEQVKDEFNSVQQNKDVYVTQKYINLWNFTTNSLGYWISKQNLETGTPDNFPDYTRVLIKHTMFSDREKYRVQVGSGVRDIYQNCYLPCSGPDCSGAEVVNDVEASCCNGTSTADSTCTEQ